MLQSTSASELLQVTAISFNTPSGIINTRQTFTASSRKLISCQQAMQATILHLSGISL